MTTEQSRPHMPVVATPVWRDGDGDLDREAGVSIAYYDYSVGEGLTNVLIGISAEGKPGLELIIGGSQINAFLNDVLTLADVRQLRDNLSALLADPRVAAIELAGGA